MNSFAGVSPLAEFRRWKNIDDCIMLYTVLVELKVNSCSKAMLYDLHVEKVHFASESFKTC